MNPKRKGKKERTKTPNPRVLSTPLVGINGAAGGGKPNKVGPMTCLVPRWNNQSGKQSSMESLEERNSCMVELMKHEERKGGEASPHKRRLKCVTNISPRRLMTYLLHQMVHYRTTLRGSEQRSATIARITIHTHATRLNIKRRSHRANPFSLITYCSQLS